MKTVTPHFLEILYTCKFYLNVINNEILIRSHGFSHLFCKPLDITKNILTKSYRSPQKTHFMFFKTRWEEGVYYDYHISLSRSVCYFLTRYKEGVWYN